MKVKIFSWAFYGGRHAFHLFNLTNTACQFLLGIDCGIKLSDSSRTIKVNTLRITIADITVDNVKKQTISCGT
jgi:hypothetical protein